MVETERAVRGDIGRFFAWAFIITWGLQLPGVLARMDLLPGGVEPYMLPVMLGIFGPSLAAWLVMRRAGGSERKLVRGRLFRKHWMSWSLLALLLPGLALAGPALVAGALGSNAQAYFPPPHAGAVVVAIVISWGEELGWRGFALPALAHRFGRVKGSMILGGAWAVWHIPMFVGVDVPIAAYPAMLPYFLGGSVVFSWLYFRSGGSLFVVICAHAGAHLNNSHAALPGDVVPVYLHALGLVLLAGVLLFDRKAWR